MDSTQPLGKQRTKAGDQRRGQDAVLVDTRKKRAPGHILHGQPRPVGKRIGVQEPRHPVRTDHGPRDQRFLLEPRPHEGIQLVAPDPLHRDRIATRGVGEVYLSHPTRAQLLGHGVPANPVGHPRHLLLSTPYTRPCAIRSRFVGADQA